MQDLHRLEVYAVIEIHCGYSEYQKLMVQLAALGAVQDSVVFGSDVEVIVAIEEGRASLVSEVVRELSAGRGTVVRLRLEERMSRSAGV